MGKQPSTLRIESPIRTKLAPLLREDGFSGSGRTYRRSIGGWIQVVNVQGSRYGGSFAINLAIHPLGVPDGLGNPPNPKKITQELCELRRRLSEESSDYWWSYNDNLENMERAVVEAAAVYARSGRPALADLAKSDSPFNTVTPSQFARDEADFLGFGSTKARMALVLSRLRRVQGRIQESREFAAYGLTLVGNALLLRGDLQALVEQSDA